MTLTVDDLSALPADKVEQAESYLKALLQELNPTLELRRGVVGDLLLHLAGITATANNENIDRVRRSSSLQAIEEDPTLAEDDVVDRVLSNYRITRQPGEPATGTVRMVISQLVPVTIAQGAVFSANGMEFTADAAFAARTTSAAVLSPNDRLLTAVGDGTYQFTFEVTATTNGLAGRLKRNTRLVPRIAPPNFVTSYASGDFGGGADEETNAQLIARLQEGISPQAWSNRANILTLLRGQESLATIRQISAIGFGDAEMLRDQHTILPISLGGRVDLYLFSRELPQAVAVTVTATLVDETADGGIWQFSLDRDDAPGFYEVTRISLPTSTLDQSYEVRDDIRSFDLTGDGFLPDILSAEEAVYSRYQTGTIRFLDTDTLTTELTVGTSTQEYQVLVAALPLIAEAQEFLNDREVRCPAGDVLVKAAVPCFLSLSFNVHRQGSAPAPDETAIANALADYVNQQGFAGRLYASALADVVQELLPTGCHTGAIDMFGRVRRPNGSLLYLRSTELLVVGAEDGTMVSDRTVVFFLDPEDVAISVQNV